MITDNLYNRYILLNIDMKKIQRMSCIDGWDTNTGSSQILYDPIHSILQFTASPQRIIVFWHELSSIHFRTHNVSDLQIISRLLKSNLFDDIKKSPLEFDIVVLNIVWPLHMFNIQIINKITVIIIVTSNLTEKG